MFGELFFGLIWNHSESTNFLNTNLIAFMKHIKQKILEDHVNTCSLQT